MLPKDLISEILLRLPVKSLLRCKLVSKPWLSLISNPNFIKSHLRHAITKPGADETLIIYEENDNSMSLLNLDSPQTMAPLGFPFSRGDYSFEPDYKIVDSYNGIVCVSVTDCPRSRAFFDFDWYYKNSYSRNNPITYIWNPATKQSKLVPPHNITDNVMSVAIGFGFEPVSNDFKVLRVVSSWDKPFSAEVYSANANVWRMVDPRPTDYPDCDGFVVCVNGFLCCGGLHGMMAFDLDKEVFTCGVRLPARSFDYCITKFNDSIAIITSKGNEWNCIFKLWTLDDETCLRGGGVEASWTVKLTIDVNFRNPHVYGCFNSGDFLLYAEDGICLLYNSHTKEARNVSVTTFTGRRMIRYNESLVSIPGSKQVDWNAHEDDS